MLKPNFAPAKISLPRNSQFAGFVFGGLTAEWKGCGDYMSCGLGAVPGGSLLTVVVVDVLDEDDAAQHHGHHGPWRRVAHGTLCCRETQEKGMWVSVQRCRYTTGLTQALVRDPPK